MTKRQILEELKPDKFIVAMERLELPVADRRARDLRIEALASSREARIAEIVGELKRDRLEELCRAFGLDDNRPRYAGSLDPPDCWGGTPSARQLTEEPAPGPFHPTQIGGSMIVPPFEPDQIPGS